MPGEAITEYQNTDIAEDLPVFNEYLYLPPQSSEDISTRAFGAQGKAYNVNTNQNYRNAFNSSVSNHYYAFSISSKVKITGRAWNMPLSSNFDIALYQWSTAAKSWKMVAFSQHPRAIEEQLSYVAKPGKYLFEVAMNGNLNTNLYSFNVSTQSTYDSQEADDNYWQARFQRNYKQVKGTLDNNYDKDFIKFFVSKKQERTFSIIGGDYTAELHRANGALAYTLPSKTLATLEIPPGTWYWVISSPSKSVNPGTNYIFSQQDKLDTLKITFKSDSQRTYSQRIDWGSGKHFPIYRKGIIRGLALDKEGNPMVHTKIKIFIKSSLNNEPANLTYFAITNADGKFNQKIKSPLGAGANMREGAKLYYHYDVHRVEISAFDSKGKQRPIPKIIEIDDIGEYTNFNSSIYLNDVSYYTYNGR